MKTLKSALQLVALVSLVLASSVGRADANTLLHRVAGVSEYVVVGVDLINCDGAPDTTTPVSPSTTSPDLKVTAVAGDNRTFYVEIAPAATVSRTSITVILTATIPASGSCVGQPGVSRNVQYLFDTSIPVDQRAAVPRAVGAVTPGPHP